MDQDRWWTQAGWAAKGSQLQTQPYVNRRPEELSAAVCQALPSLAERTPAIRWVAPLETNGFAEPRDEAFLHALELDHLASAGCAYKVTESPNPTTQAVPVSSLTQCL